MMIRTTLFGLLLAACIVFTGCVSNAEIKPKRDVSLTLDAAKKTSNATLKLYDAVTLTLPPPEGSGLQWQIAFHDARYLKQMTEITAPSASTNGPTVKFLAKNPGRTRLRFVLTPATSNRSVDPVDQLEVIFSIE